MASTSRTRGGAHNYFKRGREGEREREIFLHDFTVLIWSHSDNVITTKEKDEGKDSLGSYFYGI